MDNSIESDFIANFHSINGNTANERRCNLYLLLNRFKSNQKLINFNHLTPKTFLEELLKIDALIFYKRTPELFQILINENPIHIKKVLTINSPWFIYEAFKDIDGQKLVTDLFPNLSYIVKLKLINNFLKHLNDTEKCVDYFMCIRKSYGLFLASKLLPACNEDVIISTISEHKVDISARQFLMIIKTYPHLIEELFELLDRHNYKTKISEKYRSSFKYLALKHPRLFVKLASKYKADVYVGASTTKNLARSCPNDVILKSKKMIDHLNIKQLYHVFNEEQFVEYYSASFPNSLKTFESMQETVLSRITKLPCVTSKFAVFIKAFRLKYGSEIWEHKSLITENFLKIVPVEERMTWMKNNCRPNSISEATWLSFMHPSESIPKIQEMLLRTCNISDRTQLVAALVKTCANNNEDLSSLFQVSEYMMQKHRNDNWDVRATFLDQIASNFNLEKFNANLWNSVHQFFKLALIDELNIPWRANELCSQYIHYCCENDMPIKDLLMQYLQIVSETYFNICRNHYQCKYHKKFLLEYLDVIPSYTKDPEKLSAAYIAYLYNISKWNKLHPKDRISYFDNEEAIECIKKNLLREDNINFYESIITQDCIMHEFDKSLSSDLISTYCTQKPYDCWKKVHIYLIKNHPHVLFDFNKPTLVWRNSKLFNRNLRSLTFLDGYDNNKSIILNEIKLLTENDFEKTKRDWKHYQFSCLPYILNTDEYINLIQHYYPTTYKIDYISESQENLIKIQRIILQGLKNIQPPTVTLQPLLKFFAGDFLKFALKPLSSVTNNLNEKSLTTFLETLYRKPAPIQKHALYLYFCLFDKQTIISKVEEAINTKTDPMVQKHLFKSIFKYYSRNPDDVQFWEFAKQTLKTVDPEDVEIYLILTKCRNIPQKQFSEYITFTWDHLKLITDNRKSRELRGGILKAIDKHKINILLNDYIYSLLNNYLFTSDEDSSDFQERIFKFAQMYLIFGTQATASDKVKLIVSLIRTYLKPKWNDLNFGRQAHEMLTNFFQTLCLKLAEKDVPKDEQLILEFLKNLNDIFEYHEIVLINLNLEFILIYIRSFNQKLNPEEIGEKLGQLCDVSSSMCVPTNFICNNYEKIAEKFIRLNSNIEEAENVLSIAEGVLNNCSSTSRCIFALSLLPKEYKLLSATSKNKLCGIISSLLSNKSSEVLMNVHSFLSEH